MKIQHTPRDEFKAALAAAKRVDLTDGFEIDSYDFDNLMKQGWSSHPTYTKEQLEDWAAYSARLLYEKRLETMKKAKLLYKTRRSINDRSMVWLWRLAVLAILLGLAVPKAHCQSQIENIQFLDSTDALIKTIAAPFKFKCGTGTACTALGNKITLSSAGSVTIYGAKGDGTTNDTAAILAADTVAGVNGTILIPPGVYKVNSLTLVSHLICLGVFSVQSGQTLTIGSPDNIISSNNRQIFTGAGTVAFGHGGGTVYPDWWTSNTIPSTTDMTSAVQKALTAGLPTETPVTIGSRMLLTASINYDRLVDAATSSNWYSIRSFGGGGFIVKTAITMFDTTLPVTTAPQTQQLKFENIVFESSDATLAAYVLNDKYLRIGFEGCSFYKIKCVNATLYLQSFRFSNCVVRGWGGVFFNSPTQTYDFHLTDSIFEADDATGTGAFNIVKPNGSSIIGNLLEGLHGYAITYNGARGLTISGNFFESNIGVDIDGSGSIDTPTMTIGVAIIGNRFWKPNATDICIKWGTVTRSGMSTGNVLNSSGILHDLGDPTAQTSTVSIEHDSSASGSLLSAAIPAHQKRVYFMDKVNYDTGGYLYGSAPAGGDSILNLGVRYSNVNYDLIKLHGQVRQIELVGLPVYANNAAALLGNLTVGALYRTGADPDPVCVVH